MDASELLANNKRWAHQVSEESPELFATLAKQQSPKYQISLERKVEKEKTGQSKSRGSGTSSC